MAAMAKAISDLVQDLDGVFDHCGQIIWIDPGISDNGSRRFDNSNRKGLWTTATFGDAKFKFGAWLDGGYPVWQ